LTKLIRITTVPISLKYLITGQMKYMAKNGFEVTMMSADGPEITEVIEQEGVPHIKIPLTRKITPLQDLKALWILYRQLSRIKPEIVHTHTPKAGIIGMLAAWLARVPIRLHTVAGLPLQTTTGNKRKLLEWIETITYAFATGVWPNSQSLYNFIIENKFAKKEKLHIIGSGSSNGISIDEFNPETLDQKTLSDISKSIDYNPQNKYLLFVGRVVRDKGIEELVLVFEELQKKYANLKLVIVGPLENDLDPLSLGTTESIAKNESIITTGFSKEVKYFMHLADLFIFPSHREGFPNVPMQAGLMSCPVVASRITGNIDLINHMETGLLHEKADIVTLKKELEFAINHPEKMQELSFNFKVVIKNTFARKKMQKLIFNEYQKLLTANA